jgi:hypothetical protein
VAWGVYLLPDSLGHYLQLSASSLWIWKLEKGKRYYLFETTVNGVSAQFFCRVCYRGIICGGGILKIGDFDVPHSNVKQFLFSLGPFD